MTSLGRIRALDEVGLIGTGGIDGRSVVGSSRLLGAGGSSVNTAEDGGQNTHGELSAMVSMMSPARS
jgi:hypothetical protein